MSALSDPLSIILIAVIAFIGYRLWSVLGQRTGLERAPEPQKFSTEPKPNDLLLDAKSSPANPVWEGYAPENSDLAKGLAAIASADPQFHPQQFLAGAKVALERILEAFAKPDLATLKFLLAKEPYTAFEKEISRRNKEGESQSFKFIGVNSMKLVAARMDGKLAVASVRFDTQVISAMKNKAGAVISGDERKVSDVKELWSFERDTSSTDPNWKLAETHDE